jgi:hypothetical protein
MLPELMRLLGVDLNLKFAEIRAQAEDFRATTIRAVAGQVRETSLMVGFAVIGAIAALATLVIVLIALYRWVEMYHGPFAALAAMGVVMALLAGVMFMLAFARRGRKCASAAAHRPPPPSPPPSQPALSAVPPSLPSGASLFDILTHRFSTRLAGASDDAIDAAVHIMRTGSRSALFGTLAVAALVGVLIGRRH